MTAVSVSVPVREAIRASCGIRPAATIWLRYAAARQPRARPEVLVHDERSRAAGLEHGARFVQVVRGHDPGRRALEDRQVELAVTVEVRQRDLGDRPVGVPAEEGEVEDADQPSIHEIDDVVQAFTGASAGGELDDEIVHRSQLDRVAVRRARPHVGGLAHERSSFGSGLMTGGSVAPRWESRMS